MLHIGFFDWFFDRGHRNFALYGIVGTSHVRDNCSQQFLLETLDYLDVRIRICSPDLNSVQTNNVEVWPCTVELNAAVLAMICDRWAKIVGSALCRSVYVWKRFVYSVWDVSLRVIRYFTSSVCDRWQSLSFAGGQVSLLTVKVACTDLTILQPEIPSINDNYGLFTKMTIFFKKTLRLRVKHQFKI